MKGVPFFNFSNHTGTTEKSYFRVKLIAAGNKNKLGGDGKSKKKMTYKERKEHGIQQTRSFFDKVVVPSEAKWMEIFENHKKKDDLADTVMQALSYIDKRPVETSEPKKAKKQMPRKPTDNQTRTKYSKANLAYLVKMGAKQDARFKKDLARYYRDLDELVIEFGLK